MWPFNKKQKETLDLPPFPVPKPSSYDLDEEVIMENIPDELPPIEEKSQIIVPERDIEEKEAVSVQRPAPEPGKISSKEFFISTEAQNKILASITDVEYDFDETEKSVEEAEATRLSKEAKMDSLQKSMEDVSKKLMEIDNSLFGG